MGQVSPGEVGWLPVKSPTLVFVVPWLPAVGTDELLSGMFSRVGSADISSLRWPLIGSWRPVALDSMGTVNSQSCLFLFFEDTTFILHKLGDTFVERGIHLSVEQLTGADLKFGIDAK